jgi:hypothetical protein
MPIMDVYLETGKTRTFAAAIDWPGWCRSGKDETLALQALFDYAPRYQRAIAGARLDFTPPTDLSAFSVVERLTGNAGTDFGAPSVTPSADHAPLEAGELERLQALLQAVWLSFDAAVQMAEGRSLRTGPRGGGRDLDKIVQHVFDAEQAYLNRLGGKLSPEEKKADPRRGFATLRQAVLNTLGPAARGELPGVGPRGGARWGARFYVRYAAWHLLDHAWEIEDRIL